MNKKRIWVLVLALTLLLGTLTPAFATETAESVPTEETQPEQTQPEENFQTIYIQTPEDLLDLAEKCRLCLDAPYAENSRQGMETRVRYGQPIGRKPPQQR